MRWLFLLFVLSGCAVIPHGYPEIDYANKPPADWPKLIQHVQYGTLEQVNQWCGKWPGFEGERKAGCALIYFNSGHCWIYMYKQDPELLEHEQAHCQGYVHVGQGDIAHKAWAEHKAKK